MKLPPALEEKVAESRAILREGFPWWLAPFVGRTVAAITLGRRIYVRPAERADRALRRLVIHELVHVRQVGRHGLIPFLVLYVAEFVRHLIREKSVSRAYQRISFEVEAYAAESEADV